MPAAAASLFSALLPDPAPIYAMRADWPRFLGGVALLLAWAGVLILSLSIEKGSPIVVYAATVPIALSFVASDLARAAVGGITCMTVFSVIAALTAAANVVGLLEHGGPSHNLYFLYTADEHLGLAAWLGLAFAVLPVLGFRVVQYNAHVRSLTAAVPKISSDLGGRWFVRFSVALALVVTVVHAVRPYPVAGTHTFLVLWWPNIAAFTLARLGVQRRDSRMSWLALCVALAESARAFFFGYLRGDIATPMFALLAGTVLGARSLRLPFRVVVPALLVGTWWAANYGLLGEVRGRVLGPEKVRYMRDYQATRFVEPDATPQHGIVTRLTSFNQLSQIGRLVERDGFYHGETFSYLGVVIVPRFLWPEKPRIALGTWYALRIGQAVETPDGWANTSINMTQAGELYLNWGWLGVLLGLPIFGAICGLIWTRANFWEQGPRNVLGGALGLIMMWMMLGAHGEFTAVFTLLAVYLLLLALSFALQAIPVCRRRLAVYLHVPRIIQLSGSSQWRGVALSARGP